jgi:hypothetical protein
MRCIISCLAIVLAVIWVTSCVFEDGQQQALDHLQAEVEQLTQYNQQLTEDNSALTHKVQEMEAMGKPVDPTQKPFIRFSNLRMMTGNQDNPSEMGSYLVGLVYGQKNDQLELTREKDGALSLWVTRGGKQIRHLDGDGPTDTGETMPVQVYLLFDQNHDYIMGVPSSVEAPVPDAPKDQGGTSS